MALPEYVSTRRLQYCSGRSENAALHWSRRGMGCAQAIALAFYVGFKMGHFITATWILRQWQIRAHEDLGNRTAVTL
jgi:hypothetical protein